jgi:putative ABC transport system permease protein
MAVVYRPLANDVGRVVLAVRTAGPPADASAMIKHQLRALVADLPIVSVQTIEERLNEAIAEERLLGTLALTLGVIAVLIASIGLHALLSYDVAQRTREIGVRLAMGATARNVVSLVLRDTVILVSAALAAGIPIGIAATRPLRPQFYGIQPSDPATLAMVGLVLLIAGLLATLRPAQAAVRVNPVMLLRHD